MKYIIAIASVLTCSILTTAFGQTVVGRAIVDGQTVELLSDQSWRYEANKGSTACKTLDLGLSFCGSPDVWAPTTIPNPDIHSSYRYDDRLYGIFILEGIGSNDGAGLDFFKKAALEQAAFVSGLTDSTDVPVLEVEPVTIGEVIGERMVYSLSVDGLGAIYANSIVVLEDRAFQIVTFEVGSEFTERHRELHDEFFSLVKIDATQ